MSLKSMLKKAKLPMPGGTIGKYSKAIKIGAALTGAGGLGAMIDPEVTGARGSAKSLGRSVDQAKDKKVVDAIAVEQQQQAAAVAAAAAAEEPFTKAKESQAQALKRKGRRSSILTSAQGASEPLGIPG
jgi:hypothetical protein